ncbi:MAG: DUF4270 domain-containing protein [Prevotella sp.]|nr:DUF4270 domain-containing protein [Prevotella sp.]
MKLKHLAALSLLFSMTFAACSDNTDTIGQSLTDNMDHVQIYTDTFTVTTRSIEAGAVVSRTQTGLIGRIKDPETGAYITGDMMTQLHIPEGFYMISKDSLINVSPDGQIYADSCSIRYYYNSFLGDSLATMKATLYELEKPVEEGQRYYSDFDPIEKGYIRTAEGAIKKQKSYTLHDYTIGKSGSIKISLNDPYTDRNGKTYNNYGTYLMRSYYEHPEYYKNSQKFIYNVCPGFFLKTDAGIGSMANIVFTEIDIYFHTYRNDSTIVNTIPISGTEEVLQLTKVSNDNEAIKQLVSDNTCTYLKTPAGIFTEMTIPVEKIMNGHANDTLNTAKVALTRINNIIKDNNQMKTPSTVMMILKDSVDVFFDKNKVPNNRDSFLALTSGNTYTFNNISNLIRLMYRHKQEGKASEDWDKVLIIPVTTTTQTLNNTTTIVKVDYDMSLTSTRLVGGSENPHNDITLSVIYSKFSDH